MDSWVIHQKSVIDEQNEEYSLSQKQILSKIVAAERIEELLYYSQKYQHDANPTNNTSDASVDGARSSPTLKLSSYHYNTVIFAWTRVLEPSSRILKEIRELDKGTSNAFVPRGIPQRASQILEQMEKLSMIPGSSVKPSIETYNSVIKAWSLSHEHRAASMAQSIFHKLARLPNRRRGYNYYEPINASDEYAVSSVSASDIDPNECTYKTMIRAWCQSNQKGAAFNATGYLFEMEDMWQSGHDIYQPSLDDYLRVLKAWSETETRKYASRRAISILNKMESFQLGRPNADCYKYVLLTISKTNPKHMGDLGLEVERLLSNMDDSGLTPDADCFTAAIRTWKNSALHHSQSSESSKLVKSDALKADEMLHKMAEMYHRTSTVYVKPTTLNYNDVIEAWSKSSANGAAERVEELLVSMEKQSNNGDSQVSPNYESYKFAIDAWTNSYKLDDKVERSMSVLNRLLAQHCAGNMQCKPTVDCYNAVIETCQSAYSIGKNNEKIIQAVTTTVQKLRHSNDCNPNSTTYTLLLRTIAELLPLDSKNAIEVIFTNCCTEGLVDDTVIKAFQAVATNDMYQRIIMSAAMDDDLISTKTLPKEWTRNVYGKEVRVRVAEGVRTLPLTVHGTFVNDSNLFFSEQKMEKLKSKRNQRLLRGGRMS